MIPAGTRGCRKVVLVALACAAACRAHSAALTLVEEGAARATIVLPESPSPAALEAAKVLEAHLHQISGARLAVVKESAVSGAATPERPWILVGHGRLAERSGFSTRDLGPGGIVLEARGAVLALFGEDLLTPDDSQGTLYAVTTFLEEKLDVRYLWPGEGGKVVPRRKTVTVDEFSLKKTPLLVQRRLRAPRDTERVRSGLGRLGFTEEEYRRRRDEAERTTAGSPDWFRWQKLGGTSRLKTGHAFGHLWDRYGKAHPEWFARQPDGSRDQSRRPKRARLCKSNPGLIAAIAEEKIRELERHPELLGVSIAPNDGGHSSFCSCAACEALDAPGGADIVLTDFSSWKKREYEHVSLTDRMVWFWNAIAERVERVHPRKLLVIDAYSAYSDPPVERKLHPNLVVRFVPMSYLDEEKRKKAKESWSRWSALSGRLLYRPNILLAGNTGTALVYVRRFASDFREMARSGMIGTDFDSVLGHWATQGLNYYVAARLNWDPEQDVDLIVSDYCRAGFGEAAGLVREYFDRVESLTLEAASGSRRPAKTIPPEAVPELLELLNAARARAGADEAAARRVDFLLAGLRWTGVESQAHEASASPDAASRREVLERRERLMREMFQRDFLAVNVAAVSEAEDGDFRLVMPTWKQLRSRLP